MRSRDVFEASCHAALTKYKEDVAAGTWQPTADGRLVHRLLKAWEQSMLAAARAERQAALQRREAAIQPLVQAVQRIKADAS